MDPTQPLPLEQVLPAETARRGSSGFLPAQMVLVNPGAHRDQGGHGVSTAPADRLFGLVPAVHRIRDAGEGDHCVPCLPSIGEEFGRSRRTSTVSTTTGSSRPARSGSCPTSATCSASEGVIPADASVFSQRGFVANTLAYRRAKGTAAVLEQLARDVTGWPAKAVEYFDRLATTRPMNHERRSDVAFVEVRDADATELGGGPFDPAAHTVDVRHIDNGRGRHNIPNVGIHLWRLQAYVIPLDMEESGPERLVFGGTEARPVPSAAAAEQGRFWVNPLGVDAPMFNVPRAERAITQHAAEANVPGELRRLPLHTELERRRQAIADGVDFDALWFDDRQPVDTRGARRHGAAVRGDRDLRPRRPGASDSEGWPRPPLDKTYRRSADGQSRTSPSAWPSTPSGGEWPCRPA